MPNYGLVVNPTYNPMRFEDYIKPFTMYNEAYNQTMDNYDKLISESAGLTSLAQSKKDEEAYNIFNDYSQALSDATTELMNNGLRGSRKRLSKLRNQYFTQIQPIEKAMEYQSKLSEEVFKMNPTGDLLFTFNPEDVPIMEYVKNPNLRPKAYSLSEWEKRGFEYGKAASTRANLSIKDIGDLQYRLSQQGYTADDVSDFLAGNHPELQTVLDSLYSEMNFEGLSSEQKDLLKKRTISGLITGLTNNQQLIADRGYDPLGWANYYSNKQAKDSLNYQVYEYDDNGNPKIIYVPGSNGKPGRIGEARFDKNKNIVDVKPIIQDDKVVPFNPYNDIWDVDEQKVIINGKRPKTETKTSNSQKIAQVKPVIFTHGNNWAEEEGIITFDNKDVNEYKKQYPHGQNVSYVDLTDELKKLAKQYVEKRIGDVDEDFLKNFEYFVYQYQDINQKNVNKKHYQGTKGHSVFIMYPRNYQTVPSSQAVTENEDVTENQGINLEKFIPDAY